jgi:transcriptional regulator GlxA family with amidase domain
MNMQTGTNIDFAAQRPRGIAPPGLGPTTGPASRRTSAASGKTQGGANVDAVTLLEDVRVALDCDIGAAVGVATRLLDVLRANQLQKTLTSRVSIKLPRWKMRKLEQYIDDHLEEPILISDLAKLVSLSTSYFCRAFKADTGETPHTFIMRAKIDRARTMMLTTTLALSQIASACGLADQSHLCRCFRQIMGTSPAAWRRSHARNTGPVAHPVQDSSGLLS